ncbi:hypothetical protein DFJ73DRAFT_821313 [Zopfochytrium polystomum]|nr:hypothetical protein DFJ73DRAFT_821313 [Zopfochytrium polystomum]
MAPSRLFRQQADVSPRIVAAVARSGDRSCRPPSPKGCLMLACTSRPLISATRSFPAIAVPPDPLAQLHAAPVSRSKSRIKTLPVPPAATRRARKDSSSSFRLAGSAAQILKRALDEKNVPVAYQAFLSLQRQRIGGPRLSSATYLSLLELVSPDEHGLAPFKAVFTEFRKQLAAGALTTPPPEDMYNRMMKRLGEAGLVDEVVALWQDMQHDGVVPTLSTYNLTLYFVAKKGIIRDARAIFSQALVDKSCTSSAEVLPFRPNAQSYVHLISAYCKGGKLDVALAIFDQINSPSSRIQPNSAMYNTLLGCLANKGDLDGAAAIFDSMVQRGILPNIYTYNILLGEFARRNNMTAALQVLERLRPNKDRGKKGGKDQIVPNDVTYNTLVSMFARQKMVNEAESVITAMRDAGVSPNAVTISALMQGYYLLRDAEGCRKVMEDAFSQLNIKPSNAAFHTLMKAYSEKGDVTAVEALFHEMTTRWFLTPSAETFYVVIKACSSVVDWVRMDRWFSIMLRHGFTVNAETLEAALGTHLASALVSDNPSIAAEVFHKHVGHVLERKSSSHDHVVIQENTASRNEDLLDGSTATTQRRHRYASDGAFRYPPSPMMARLEPYLSRLPETPTTTLSNILLGLHLRDGGLPAAPGVSGAETAAAFSSAFRTAYKRYFRDPKVVANPETVEVVARACQECTRRISAQDAAPKRIEGAGTVSGSNGGTVKPPLQQVADVLMFVYDAVRSKEKVRGKMTRVLSSLLKQAYTVNDAE